ncbi:MAG: carboxypeptidase-like regulatory domain-containing protein [Planctomycetia bacterium]
MKKVPSNPVAAVAARSASRVLIVLAVCALLACPLLAGCGRKTLPVVATTGTVTLDGEPVGGASVTFMPTAGPPGTAVTDDQGRYAVQTSGRPGAIVGENLVAVSKASGAAPLPEMPANPTPDDMRKAAENKTKQPAAKSELPAHYGTVGKSGLKATVTADPTKNVFNFALESDSKKK